MSDLQKDLPLNGAVSKLEQYLRILRSLVISAAHHKSLPDHRHEGCSSLIGAPDSAIDISHDMEEVSSTNKNLSALQSGASFEHWDDGEVTDEFDGELNEMPVQALRPPPRSSSRLKTLHPNPPRVQQPNAKGDCDGAEFTPDSHQPGTWGEDSAVTSPRPLAQEPCFRRVAQLPPPHEDCAGRRSTRSYSCGSSTALHAVSSTWETPRSEIPSPAHRRSSPSHHRDSDQRHQAASQHSSSTLSMAFRNLSLRRPSTRASGGPPAKSGSAVFGVPLDDSIRVARGIASARHGSGGSSARGTREYPLSILRCVCHIRDCGLDAPHIFDLDGDQLRLAQLKEDFNSAETYYGKNLDWSRFTVYDAADLILLFLAELPKPLVSESVGKRWVSLARQATDSTSRFDHGMDFWENALLGVRGPACTLLKLLLNLWGDITHAAAANGMTAERLAARVVRPLMHASAARQHSDFALGLAFMIRKRAEYNRVASRCT